MYASPKVTDFGRIEVHTYSLSGSAPEIDETPITGSTGGGAGIGVLGLVGGAAVLAGRADNGEPAAGVTGDEDEKQVLK